MLLTLDIETLPTTDADLIAEFSYSITAPAQYKKPDSIAEWMAQNKDDALKERVAKTSFDGLYGSIACICYAFDDGEVHAIDSREGEKLMLERFYTHVFDQASVSYHDGVTYIPMTIVGHNVAGFDLPFLKHRSIIHSVKPIRQLLSAMNAKAWDKCIADTMLMWSSDREKRVSMDKLCKVFGIMGKNGFDGSMVADTWPSNPQKVIDYCADDVKRTRAIYKRLTFTQ